MNYTIYDPVTGQISGTLQTENQELAELNLAGKNYIEGSYNDDYYIENNQAVLKPARPINTINAYVFDYELKTWTIDSDASINTNRTFRNQLLSQIDRINPVWYASLSQEQQQALAAYRQQLLDVPQQSGFPSTVEWPAKPVWL